MQKASKFNIDWYIVVSVLFLVSIGMLVQSSIAYKSVGVRIDIDIATQIIAAIAGSVVGVLIAMSKPWKWNIGNWFAYIAAIVLIILVLIIGSESGGSQRWLELGSLRFQPTEFAKLALVFVLASLLDVHSIRANRPSSVIRSLLPTVPLILLITLQPDLGSAIALVVIWLTMLITSRIRMTRFGLVLLLIVAIGAIMVPFMAEYQQQRLVSYFNPTRDVSGANYNVAQATIALGSGGLTGKGLEAGSQSQLNFLPSQHTDFVFAVVGEKLGLIGASLVILALTIILTRLLYKAWRTQRQYIRLLLVGFVSIIAFHSIVNIGMNLGLLPVTGLPLPAVSYGGSFMFVTSLIVVLGAVIPTEQSGQKIGALQGGR